MPIFLPFLRAVKAPSASRLVCALFIGSAVNCGPASTPHASPGPPTGPLPIASYSGASNAPASAEPGIPDARSALTDAGGAAEPTPSPALQISVDLPYPADARPRAQDPTQAAAEDEDLARWNLGGSSDPNSISSQASYHPGTRVVVDTRPAKRRAGAPPLPAPRGLSYQRVQAQARSRGYWPFRVCFERGQRDKKGPGGETRVAFSIGTRGKVTAARLLDSKLENAASAACMVRELQKLEFSPPPASKLRMVASIQVYPGDAELPVVPDAAVVASLPRGEFDPEAM
ncbi:MAG TPA: AgmX/PglI C-terminal domain-containing protein, partial [Polyangiaceae bacterium]|nr:AgmX/PglI C-terminal domain-containing protein [Polyangiaceae bacterium]